MKEVLKGLVFAISFCISGLTFGQNASISGVITDALSGEKLFSVKVVIQGLGKGATTDLEGKYAIKGLSSGAYKVDVRYNEYNNLLLDVVLKENENFIMDLKLEKASQLGPVTLQGKVSKESTTELIRMQRNSASVVDGTTAENFKKTPDSKASDIFKRISGASIQDNRFVIVRGLSDRYNFALINGVPLPSSESDRKAFSFDIFAANMLDNIMITKTANPELPGEFSGGVVDIATSEPKDKNFTFIQLGSTVNTITSFQNFKTYEGGKLDFLGLGSAYRELPIDLPSTTEFATALNVDKARFAKMLTPTWSTFSRMALPNTSLQFSIGRKYNLSADKIFSFVAAYSYSKNWSRYEQIRREFEESSIDVVQRMELTDTVYATNIINSAMVNMKLVLNPKNQISFKNLYSINADDKVNVRKGIREMDNDPKQFERATNFWYTQSNLYTGQLIGKHELGEKTKFNWNLGYSNVMRKVPNLRRIVYRKYASFEDDTTEQYVAVIQNNGSIPTAAGNMFWSDLNENIYSSRYDLSRKMDVSSKWKNEIKIGGWNQFRKREFTSRNLGFSQYKPQNGSFNSSLLLLPEDQIFNVNNLGLIEEGVGGFKLDEVTNVDDSYRAFSFLNGAFLMLDSKWNDKIRFVGGARLESYYQNFQYIEFGSNQNKVIDTNIVDILPSFNLIYSPLKKLNIRLGYSQTVSRPEFRELAPFTFYDFIIDNIISGDPYLQRAQITNTDLRVDYYPAIGQSISVSGFFKQFTNPIELINRTGTSGAPELYYSNVNSVQNLGLEFEYRINLGIFNPKDSANFLRNFTVYTNTSLIRSRVDLSNFVGSGGERPLQGQSPYIINAGLFFTSPNKEWSISTSYNVVGQRIYIVGNVQEPSVWENGRHVVDIQLAKVFGEKFECKLNIKDLLAQKLLFFQDLNGNQKYDAAFDNRWQEVQFGRAISLSLKYNF